MRRLGIWALLWLGLLCVSHAQSVLPGFPPGVFTGRGALDGAGGAPPAFSGVFDVTACGTNCAYWGVRAASVADKGNRLMNVCNVADVACADLSSDATTGDLVIGTIGGSSCSIVTCTVKTLYDRGNSAFCTTYTTPCDLTQATIATRPTLVVNCAGTGKPCLACNGSQHLDNTTLSAFNQPNSVSGVAERTGGTTSFSDIMGGTGGNWQFLFNNSANQVILFADSLSAAVAGNDNTVHSIHALYSGAASVLRVDGTSSTVNPGTRQLNTDLRLCVADGSAANPLTGNFFELVIWGGADVSSGFASMYAQQKAYYAGIP